MTETDDLQRENKALHAHSTRLNAVILRIGSSLRS